MEICGDNRFEIIRKAKEHLIKSTNIESSTEEMAVIDDFLLRCWQMGWLHRYDETNDDLIRINIEIIDNKNHNIYAKKSKLDIDNLDQLKIKSVDAIKLHLQHNCDEMIECLEKHFK